MNNSPLPGMPEDIRRRIIDAAEARFRIYGYRKTTMAEIAEDCDMSAANLYRYFENKEDIGAACTARCLGERTELLRSLVRQPGLGAARKLEEFVLAMLRYTHERALEEPKVNELVELIALERPEVVHRKNEAERALFAEIIAQGNAAGEFEVSDVISAASAVHAATILFQIHIFMGLHPLEQFEQLALGVVRLLVKGLARR